MVHCHWSIILVNKVINDGNYVLICSCYYKGAGYAFFFIPKSSDFTRHYNFALLGLLIVTLITDAEITVDYD